MTVLNLVFIPREFQIRGVPMVTVARMPEQAVNSRRITELGLGADLSGVELTPRLPRDTVEAVAGGPAIRANLAKARADLHTAGGSAQPRTPSKNSQLNPREWVRSCQRLKPLTRGPADWWGGVSRLVPAG
ncbi:hypothetical protein [Actinocrispum sp. NPDC049592]|uniref:hypothetical protein n=1 Tax=Actinocrispum sp. NPDC049592 TaxID=3154835 RepID=UPI003434FF12